MTHNARFRPRFTAAILAAAGLVILTQAATAQTTTQAAPAAPAQAMPIVVGILDTEAVVLGSSAGKSLSQQADALLKQLQDATQKQEDVLIGRLKALNPQSPDYGNQRQALAAQDDKLRSDYDKNKAALDQRVGKARQNLLQAASKVIQDIAKARGLNLVLARTSVTLFPDQWNITNDVVTRLNKALPNIKL